MFFKDENNKPFYKPSDNVIKSYRLSKITEEEFNKIVHLINNPILTKEQEEQEIKNQASSYLNETEWIENYKIRHELGLELIPETSTKWIVIKQREEYKLYLKTL